MRAELTQVAKYHLISAAPLLYDDLNSLPHFEIENQMYLGVVLHKYIYIYIFCIHLHFKLANSQIIFLISIFENHSMKVIIL